MEMRKTKKLTYAVNTVILLLVLGLLGFFYMVDAPFLIYFSIPTIGIYLLGYYLISCERLDEYVWIVYIWLTTYMGVTTVCLGYGYGFHLYCFSMIPVMFVSEYFSHRLGRKGLKALPVSLGVAFFYLLCTGYVAYFGPIYVRDQKFAALFWISNALIVFGFLIFYVNYMLNMVINSEQKLREMAQMDRLTKLYNRHYVISRLEAMPAEAIGFLAMVDIDDFKKINDTYGHSAGDAVLCAVADKMREVCGQYNVARWGGEEFLIFAFGEQADESEIVRRLPETAEELRRKIAESSVPFDGRELKVTVTIGVAIREPGQTTDKWVQEADRKLYVGKKTGKNKVISDND